MKESCSNSEGNGAHNFRQNPGPYFWLVTQSSPTKEKRVVGSTRPWRPLGHGGGMGGGGVKMREWGEKTGDILVFRLPSGRLVVGTQSKRYGQEKILKIYG